MNSYSWKIPRYRPDAAYRAVLSKDGRITIPKECITDLIHARDNIVSWFLTNSLEEGILCLYTSEDFENVKEQLGRLNSMDINARNVKKWIIGEAVNIRLDSRRRIKIYSEHLMRLGIESTSYSASFPVMVLKYPNRIEIMLNTVYERIQKEFRD